MKFTKEDAYKDLVAKMTEKGEKLNLSERSLNEQLEKLIALVANDETELADFLDKTLPLFKTADANVRNDVSVGINEYKKNNPTPKVEPTKVDTPKDDANSELLSRLESLEKELADNKREKTLLGIREQLISEMKKKGVKDDEWIDNFVSEISITEDFDVNTKAEHYVGVYNKMNARINANVTPTGTGGGVGSDKRISDVINSAASLAKADRVN